MGDWCSGSWAMVPAIELPPEMFAELTEGAHYEMEPPLSRLREARRVRVKLEATVMRLGKGRETAPMPASVRDLSARGIGIECGMPVHVKDQLAFRVI